jgi:hypothetical protein
MPAGEARTIRMAYHIVVLKAITEIFEHKTKELLGSEFAHIPHLQEDEDPMLNHFKFARKKPAKAAKYMDNCKSMLTMFYQLHRTMVGEIDHMLAEFTDPKKFQKRMEELMKSSQNPTQTFSTGSFIDIAARQPVPPTPNYFPTSPYASNSFESGYEAGGDSWNMPHPDSPVKNSTGWCFETFMGTSNDPIRCDSEVDEDAMSQYWNHNYGIWDFETNPIIIESDLESKKPTFMEDGECSKRNGKKGPFDMHTFEFTGNFSEEDYPLGDVYSSLNNYFTMTDFALGTSSDSDYVPTGSQYVLEGIRRMTRSTGWTPGMYREGDYE